MTIYHASSLFTGDEFLSDVYFSVDNGVFKFVEADANAVTLTG